jgi:predicted GNAT family acetyltransferase
VTTRRTEDRALDETLDEPSRSVADNRASSRLELTIDDQTAFLAYERTPHSFVIVHTEVPPALRGRHLGDVLVKAALDHAHAEGLRVVAVCPFARAYLRKHPDLDAG